jgi:hypothetical protein
MPLGQNITATAGSAADCLLILRRGLWHGRATRGRKRPAGDHRWRRANCRRSHGSRERGRYRGAAAQVREDGGTRTWSGGAPFPPDPLSPDASIFFGSWCHRAPLVNPHTPLPRRGSSGFGWRACGAGLPNGLAAKPAPLSYIVGAPAGGNTSPLPVVEEALPVEAQEPPAAAGVNPEPVATETHDSHSSCSRSR